MLIRFKENLRSPHYGKIVVFDAKGNVSQEINILDLMLSYKNLDIKLGEVLENAIKDNSSIPNLDYRIKQVEMLEETVAELAEKVAVLSELVVLLDNQLKMSKII